MFPYGYIVNAEEAKPSLIRKPGDPMIACIRHHGGRAFCGRNAEEKEWIFNDPVHAVTNYNAEVNRIPLGGLRCCSECVKQARAEWKKESEARAK